MSQVRILPGPPAKPQVDGLFHLFPVHLDVGPPSGRIRAAREVRNVSARRSARRSSRMPGTSRCGPEPCTGRRMRSRVNRTDLTHGCIGDGSPARQPYRPTHFLFIDPREQEAHKGPMRRAGAPAQRLAARVSRTAFSRARSFRLARRIALAIMGAANLGKPDGSPRLRSVIRVPPFAVSSHV